MRSAAVTYASIALVALVLSCGGKPTPTPPAPRTATDQVHADGRRTGPTKPKDETLVGLGFVLLRSSVALDPDAVLGAYVKLAPEGPALTRTPDGRGDDLSFDQGGAVVVVGLMPAPVPGGEAEDLARFSVFGLAKHWTPPPHRTHLLVMSMGSGATPLERTRNFHRLLAAVTIAAGSEAVGVYVGGVVTHDPVAYVEAIRAIPDAIVAWCGVSVAQDGARLSLLSLGMQHLGLPDVVVTAPAAQPGKAILQFYDLLLYVARRGTALPAGDTIGRTADERIPVRYEASPIDATAQVMRVDYP